MLRLLCTSLTGVTFSLAAPCSAATITGIGANAFTFLDGTNNTLQFSEATRTSVCVQGVTTGGVSDGTSNTIFFGEVGGFTLVDAFLQAFDDVVQILDGTSNTIFFSESPLTDFCLVNGRIDSVVTGSVPTKPGGTIVIGSTGQLDLCFSSVNRSESTLDGTSNTIFLGETYCNIDVQLSSDAVIDAPVATPVPAPPALVLGMTGFALLLGCRRRRSAGREAAIIS